MRFEWNPEGWDATVKEIVEKHLEPRAQKIADNCNKDLIESAMARGKSPNAIARAVIDVGKGFVAGTETVDGPNKGEPLRKHDYRATVITASAAAMRLNAKHHTLLHHLNWDA